MLAILHPTPLHTDTPVKCRMGGVREEGKKTDKSCTKGLFRSCVSVQVFHVQTFVNECGEGEEVGR